MSSNFRCRHPDCIYRNPQVTNVDTRSFQNACNYAGITGKTRLGQLPPDMWDPKRCPLYDTGKVKNPKKVFNIPPPRKPAAPEWEPKAMELYKAGYMDTEIAAMLNVKYHQVAAFRERNKLPRNALKRERFKFDKNLALKLYKEGKNDREIAAEIGVARTSIGKWRDANGLLPNAEPRCTPAIYDFTPAMKRYEEGKNDREIAAVIGCSPQYIGKWRKKNNLPSKFVQKKGESHE